MFRIALGAILITAAFSTQVLAAPVSWSSAKDPIEVSGYPVGEDEPDYVLRITCLRGAKVQVGIGAYKDVGRGRRGTFSVTLRSGNRSATVSGQSAKSKNVEMTGSSELRAEMPLANADKLLEVLTSGLPISVSGAMNATWTVNGLAAKVRAFGEGCSKI